MAGLSRIIKENEVLFALGDEADRMYILRKGTLKVYLTKGSEEIQLAILNDGAIVGEMAFFDNKPRSANVKAMVTCEVTEITRADFDKLSQQVPKWVLTMMQSLSSRLRITNQKLLDLGAAALETVPVPIETFIVSRQLYPFQHTLRVMRLTLLSLSKDGVKEGNNFVLPFEKVKALWQEFSQKGESELFDKVITVLENSKQIQRRADSNKLPFLIFVSRGAFAHFIEFFSKMAQKFTQAKPFLSDGAVSLFTEMVETAGASGCETLNVTFGSLIANALARGVPTLGWKDGLSELDYIPNVKISKNGTDVGLRIKVKEHSQILEYIKVIQAFKHAKLF